MKILPGINLLLLTLIISCTPERIGTVTVSPNPAQDHTTVTLSGVPIKEYDFLLSNLGGQMVFSTTIQPGSQTVYFTGLGDGTYLYRVTDNADISITGKLIIVN